MDISKIKGTSKYKFLENGAYLYILQIFNTVIPMITLPYVTRVLGPSEYGIFSSALNFIGYFQVIVEYGFNLSGVRKISVANNKEEISNLYSRIISCRILLCILTFIILIIVGFFSNVNKKQYISMIILFIMIIGMVMQQIWLFQGLQVMKYITVISVISRLISVALVLIFIKGSQDLYLYCFLYALTFVLAGVISIIIAYKLKIIFKMPSFESIVNEFRDGWYLFTTSAMTKMFSGFGITVLTLTTISETVGIYSAIQKIPIIMTMMYSPISQVIYPYISKKYNNSFDDGYFFVKKISKYIMILSIIISSIMIIFAKQGIYFLYGEEYIKNYKVIIPLIFWMNLSIFNNLIGIQILVASGHEKLYSKSFTIGSVSLVILNIILGGVWNMYGVAVAAMLSEGILMIVILINIRKIKRRLI